MLELTVAAAGYDQVPTVVTQQSEDLADFHREIMLRPMAPAKTRGLT